jgi:hypothetical protein
MAQAGLSASKAIEDLAGSRPNYVRVAGEHLSHGVGMDPSFGPRLW